MFFPECTSCGQQILVGTRRMEALTNTDEGIVMLFRCFCGGEALLVTGAKRPEALAS